MSSLRRTPRTALLKGSILYVLRRGCYQKALDQRVKRSFGNALEKHLHARVPLHDTLKWMRTAYIGMGANLPSKAGPPDVTLAAAATRLASLGHVIARSSLYSTAPVGFTEQPRFLNTVIALKTDLAPHVLLDKLLSIERQFGRDRSAGIPNGPRTIDLDILMLGDLCVYETGLEIPHPRLAERAFVLIPFNEIAPQAIDPSHNKTVAELLHRLLESRKGESDAVVKVQSDVWHIGGDTADPGPLLRPDGKPDRG